MQGFGDAIGAVAFAAALRVGVITFSSGVIVGLLLGWWLL